MCTRYHQLHSIVYLALFIQHVSARDARIVQITDHLKRFSHRDAVYMYVRMLGLRYLEGNKEEERERKEGGLDR